MGRWLFDDLGLLTRGCPIVHAGGQAVVYVELGAVGGAAARVVEASAGVGVVEGSVGADLPFLVGGAGNAVVELDEGVVGCSCAGDVDAFVVDLDGVGGLFVVVGDDGE